MISQDSFVRMMHDLGDVDAPPTDGRLDGIQHKITRVRLRRTLTAAVAVIAVVAAGLAIVSARNAPPAVPANVPKSWTTADGVTYKLVGYVTLDTAHQNSVTLTVPATAPITLRYTCVNESTGSPNEEPTTFFAKVTAGAGVFANTFEPDDLELNCAEAHSPALVDFDTTKLAATGDAAKLIIKGMPVPYNGVPRVFAARWSVAVYTWVIPTTLTPAPALPPMPQMPGFRLAAVRTAVWPQHTISFQVPAHTTWGPVLNCSDTFVGAVGSALQLGLDNSWSMSIDKQPPNHSEGLQCTGRVDVDAGIADQSGPVSTTTTVTITFALDPIYQERSGIFQVGVYYKN